MEKKEEIDLLVCKCQSCTHWEIGRDVIVCKTCGLTLPAKISVHDHQMLRWKKRLPEPGRRASSTLRADRLSLRR
jgi:hypothetical protein